ncbi:MAG: hypothetical protein OHK0032_16730 [Thermodesulfovibrionales bacterium]
MKMFRHGGSPEETEDLQEDMVFRLDPLLSEESEDPPMWSMDPLGMKDWFFADE